MIETIDSPKFLILAFKNIGVHSKLELENKASEFFKIWNLIASACIENIAFPVSVDY